MPSLSLHFPQAECPEGTEIQNHYTITQQQKKNGSESCGLTHCTRRGRKVWRKYGRKYGQNIIKITIMTIVNSMGIMKPNQKEITRANSKYN